MEGCDLLQKTLDQMAALRVPAAIQWELLVVDEDWIAAHCAVVKHLVPAERLSLKSIRGFYRGLGMTYVRRGQLGQAATIAGMPRWVLRRYLTVLAKRLLGVVRRGTVWHYRVMAEQWHPEGILLESRRRAAQGEPESGRVGGP